MFELKPLSQEAIPAALEKAERYRLLNEPHEAESICLDVLAVEPDHQQALIVLLLALTDQFEERQNPTYGQAREILPRLEQEYHRIYYEGIICERRAKAQLRRRGPGHGTIAYDFLTQAMGCYEKAATMRPPGDESAVLRYNTCARIIESHSEIVPPRVETFRPMLE